MRDLLDKLRNAGNPSYELIRSLNEGAGDHPVAEHFPLLGQALDQLEEAQALVSEVMHGYMKVEAAKLSQQYPGSFVVLEGGNGVVDIEVIPSTEHAAKLDAMWDSGEVEQENQADEFVATIRALNDKYARSGQFMPFVVNDKVAKDYKVDSWHIESCAFHNGKETSVAAARQHFNTLSSIVQRATRGW